MFSTPATRINMQMLGHNRSCTHAADGMPAGSVCGVPEGPWELAKIMVCSLSNTQEVVFNSQPTMNTVHRNARHGSAGC